VILVTVNAEFAAPIGGAHRAHTPLTNSANRPASQASARRGGTQSIAVMQTRRRAVTKTVHSSQTDGPTHHRDAPNNQPVLDMCHICISSPTNTGEPGLEVERRDIQSELRPMKRSGNQGVTLPIS
jgi:hypothetical protein